MAPPPDPNYLIAYGPDANCTLAICSVKDSVYEYRPSLAASGIFIVLFAICMIIQIYQGVRWRQWGFMAAMVLGCIGEMVGYGGRIMLYQNPFSFTGFLMQIICITCAPVFFSAAIYITLSKIVIYLGREYSRLRPQLYYYIFISCDIISLATQSAGGALSSTSSGSSKVGVDVALAGLSFQVVTLCVFIALALDFVVRWRRGTKTSLKGLDRQFKIFGAFLSSAIILILIRCAYRIDELSDGYHGPLIHDQGLFIGLEGVMIIVAAFCLNIGHPGPVFQNRSVQPPSTNGHERNDTERKGVDGGLLP